MDDTRREKIVGAVIISILVLSYSVWNLSFPRREASRRSGCIGKTWAECKVPSDYYVNQKGCSDFLECQTHPPGVTYRNAVLQTNRGTVWESYAYAVIALDTQHRVVTVEIKRMYSYP